MGSKRYDREFTLKWYTVYSVRLHQLESNSVCLLALKLCAPSVCCCCLRCTCSSWFPRGSPRVSRALRAGRAPTPISRPPPPATGRTAPQLLLLWSGRSLPLPLIRIWMEWWPIVGIRSSWRGARRWRLEVRLETRRYWICWDWKWTAERALVMSASRSAARPYRKAEDWEGDSCWVVCRTRGGAIKCNRVESERSTWKLFEVSNRNFFDSKLLITRVIKFTQWGRWLRRSSWLHKCRRWWKASIWQRISWNRSFFLISIFPRRVKNL